MQPIFRGPPMTSAERDASSNSVTEPEELVGKSPAWRRRFLGDIPVGALAGNVPQVPGAGTAKGEKAIAKAMGDVLDRVRRSIRERSSRSTSARV